MLSKIFLPLNRPNLGFCIKTENQAAQVDSHNQLYARKILLIDQYDLIG